MREKLFRIKKAGKAVAERFSFFIMRDSRCGLTLLYVDIRNSLKAFQKVH